MNHRPLRDRFISAAFFTMLAIVPLALTAKAGAQTLGALSDADGNAGGMVAENSSTGTEVGIAARADNAANYTLIDSAGGLFAIDAQSGVVSVAIAMLDHEAFSSHTVIVQASTGTVSSTESFTIRVTDVPEPIRHVADIDFNPNKIIYGSSQGAQAGISARAIDPDRGSAVTYSLSENPESLFAIGRQDGIVTLASSNYAPDRDYLIEVTAMSDDNTSSTAQFTVRRDEPILIAPSPVASTLREGESQVITFSHTETQLELIAISAGHTHTCGIASDNRAVCWGPDNSGSTMPPEDQKFIAISVGDFHTCAITSDNNAVCWGNSTGGRTTPPTDGTFIAISSGGAHNCAITPDNEAVCWGSNDNGRATPPTGRKFIAVSSGSAHNCAITPDNEAVCWGSNDNGRATPPTDRKFIAVSAGARHSCAITLDNHAVCWGRNISGQTESPSDRKFIAISVGSNHSCAITPDNEAVCWGANADGRSAPPPDKKFIAITAGYFHTCSITADNEAVCWGSDVDGRRPPPEIPPTAAAPATIVVVIADASRGQLSFSDNGQAVIPAGETQATLAVTVIDDDLKESTADHTVLLSALGHAELERNEIIITVPSDDDTQAIGDLDDSDNEVAENSPAGAEVGIIVHADSAASYALSDDAGGRFAINNNGLVTVAGKLNFEDAASHSVVAQATLSDSSMTTAAFTIAVANVNEITLRDRDGRNNLARASAGSAALGIALEAVHGDNVPITAWELLQDSDAFELTQPADSSTQGLRIKADAGSLSPHIDTTTELSVIARTSYDVATETFTVRFTEQEPVFVGELMDIDGADNKVAENSTVNTPVGITVRTDNATAYTLTDDAGGRFAISPTTGIVTVADGANLNFEDAASHSITVEAGSANDRRSMRFAIDVINVDEIALRDGDGRNNVVIASTGSVVSGMTLEATHSDAVFIPAWELLQESDVFELTQPADSSTQGLRIKADAESLSAHINTTTELSVIVRTEYDAATEAFTVRFTEQEVALVGELMDIDDTADEVAENSPANTPVGITVRADNATAYALTDSAEGRFTINSTGLVTVADGSLLNFEDASSHSITVEARSANDSRSMRFAIDVINVNEIALRDGDGRNNVVVASTGSVVRGMTLETVHADNALIAAWDLRQESDVFELTQPDNSSTQGLRIKDDAESLSFHIGATTELSVIARTEYDAATITFAARFTEQEIDLVGIMDIDGAADEVAENSPANTPVGITVRADNATTYTLTDDAGGRFAISAETTGLVTVADGANLNFEDATSHSITVDARGEDDSLSMRFAIDVINVNEITLRDRDGGNNVAVASTNTVVIGMTLEAAHDDGDPITGWEIIAQTVASSPSAMVDLFEFGEPQNSATQTLRIRADADLALITPPSAVALSLSVRTAFDEAGEDFDIQIRPSRDEGIRLRVRVYLEGALE